MKTRRTIRSIVILVACSTGLAMAQAPVGTAFTYQGQLNKVVVPSRFFMEKFIEWGWSRDKFVHIPNYVDATRFEPAYDAFGYFLYFGRLAPEKGVATLMRAAKAVFSKLKAVSRIRTPPLRSSIPPASCWNSTRRPRR